MSDDRNNEDEVKRILENYNSFLGRLSQEFEAKDSYEIYLDKAKASDDFYEAVSFMEKSLAEAKKMISPELFEKSIGRLWSEENGRPYMIVKKEWADLYTSIGAFDMAINEYYELLDLNDNDDQGIRHKLINLLIAEYRYDEFEDLVDEFYNDESTLMLYPKALYYFSQEDDVNAKRYIKKAFEGNIHVPKYLLGMKILDVPATNIYAVGGEDEARAYFTYGAVAWLSVKDSLYWLVDEFFGHVDEAEFSKEDAMAAVDMICNGDEI